MNRKRFRRNPLISSLLTRRFALHRKGRNTAFVVAIALFARLLVVVPTLLHLHMSWFYNRGSEMGFLAASIAQGRGLSSPFGPPTGPTALIAPGYPLLLAGLFHLFGCYSANAAGVLIGINLLLNVLTVWLILSVSRDWADERSAVIAALFWACSPAVLGMATICWETSLSTYVLLGATSLLTSRHRIERTVERFASGAGCAIATLFNPALLPSLLVLFAYRLSREPRVFRRALPLLCGFLVLYLPWPIRNQIELHAPILTRTTVGLELWMGNHPGSQGFLNQAMFPTYNPAELSEYRDRGELSYMAHKQELAFAYMKSEPASFLRLTLRRVLRFWSGSGSLPFSLACCLHALLTTIFGLSGLYLLFRAGDRAKAAAYALPLLLFPLPYYLTHAEFRYRLVIDPLLTALMAKSLQQFALFRARRLNAADHVF